MIDEMFAAAKKRIHKWVEVRCQIERGRKPSTARRSAGQLFKRRKA